MHESLINNSIKRIFQFLQEMTDEALNINNQLVKSLLIMSVSILQMKPKVMIKNLFLCFWRTMMNNWQWFEENADKHFLFVLCLIFPKYTINIFHNNYILFTKEFWYFLKYGNSAVIEQRILVISLSEQIEISFQGYSKGV